MTFQTFYERDGIKIILGDARDVLPTIEPGSVDLLLTDPPYGIGFDYGTGYDDTPVGYGEWLWSVIETAETTLRPGGYVVCFQAAKTAREWHRWFPREWRLLALPKKFVQMFPTDMQWSTDYALFWSVGGERLRRRDWSPKPARDWFVSSSTLRGRDPVLASHPCPRPIDSVTYIVNCLCPPGGLVVDPFMGSGTTLRAALTLNRRAIGIEINEDYCVTAFKRLQQTAMNLEVA